jgi:esterase/lipase superfamily enzyme
MITNRNILKDGPGASLATMRYYSTDAAPSKRNRWLNWQELTLKELRDELLKEMKDMPLISEEQNENQKHFSLLVHGYNNAWTDALELYDRVQRGLYADKNGLGVLVLFTWPSNGRTTDYLPDRDDAAGSRDALADLFVALHDHVQAMQRLATRTDDEEKLCRAKISVIAHSMGNYVMQKALATASKRLNNPQLITLIHQMAMVAADVDNDLFQTSKPPDSDGQLAANLCYRITALYTGLDQVLGASAGLKHFGTRRLGRSGLADAAEVFDNVWDMDVSHLIKNTPNTHSAVFHAEKSLALLGDVLRGVDRTVLLEKHGP